ncbi:MAG TPA: hypothetical protein VIH57_25880 [Bacteroidales bacterium]
MNIFKSKYTKLILNLGLVVLSILSLIYPAIVNGYPLVYSDSGTYILAAPDHHVPVDRPIGYSLFIQFTGLSVSLWLTLLMQAIILVYITYRLFRDVFQIRKSLYYSSAVLILLSFLTGVSNFNSQIMPDIFVSVMVLVSAIFLLGKHRSILNSVLLSIIFLFTIISHFSDLLVISMIGIILLAFNFWKRLFDWAKLSFFLALVIGGWLLFPTVNLIYGAGFTVSRTHNVFTVGRLIEEGIVGDYLSEYCGTKHYSLCDYKEKLPKQGFVFVWDMSSPLYSGDCMSRGWGSCWIEKDKEYGSLITDIVTTPKYFVRVAKMGIRSTYNQLTDFNIGMLTSMRENTPPNSAVRKYYNKEFIDYIMARQYKRDLYFPVQSYVQRVMVYISVVVILLFLLVRKLRNLIPGRFWLFTILISAGMIFNAFICGTMSGVVDRYQARIVWLLPLLFMILLSLWLQKVFFQSNDHSDNRNLSISN